jgi:Ca2+-binding RTX toxin-like protein
MLNNQSLQAVQNQLALFAAQGNFDAIMTTAFGSRLDRAKLQLLRQQWLSGNFSVIPDIQILSQGELGTANGAYAASLDKIFVSSDFLAYATESQVTTLILEEVGHRLDQLLNGGVDSAGDEGEIFSRLVNGEILSAEQLAALKTENDRGLLSINGSVTAIEMQNSVITGTNGNDTLTGDIGGITGNDTIYGYDGNDRLYGGNGLDRLLGGNDNDYLLGESGDDFLDGGSGNDTLGGSGGVDFLHGGIGNDRLYGGSDNDDLAGEAGDDLVNGGSGDDFVNGDAGKDSLFGGLDRDYITGGIGSDELYGEEGNDYLYGESGNFFGPEDPEGNDSLFGGAGNDLLSGDNGNDVLYGGTGDDTYVIQLINDSADLIIENTNEGNDLVSSYLNYSLGSHLENLSLRGTENINGSGNTLSNLITGNSGNNILAGQLGNDTMTGGMGNDSYVIDADIDFGTKTITEASSGGFDNIDFSASAIGISLNLSALSTQTISANLLLTNIGLQSIERVYGGSGNDTITGNASENTLRGGIGSDVLTGGAGNDTYIIDADVDLGTDAIIETPRTINDPLSFFGATDTLDFSSTTTKAISVSLAIPIVFPTPIKQIKTVATGVSIIISANLIEDIIGGSLGDSLTGNGLENNLDGGVGNDTLRGGAGNDQLQDRDGDDALYGESGDDRLKDVYGNDSLYGGTGNDTYYIETVNSVGTIIEYTNEGLDRVQSIISYTLGDNVENLSLNGLLQNNLSGTGNSLSNKIYGDGGNNLLTGKTGNDTLIGGFGNDIYVIDADVDFGTKTITEVTFGNISGGIDSLDFRSSAIGINLNLNGFLPIGTQTLATNVLLNNSDLLNVENVYGGSGNDNIAATASNNVLIGGTGSDTLNGGAGNDIYH